MSEEAKEVIQTVSQGHLPPLETSNNSTPKGAQVSQKGLNMSLYFMMPSKKRGTQTVKKKKGI